MELPTSTIAKAWRAQLEDEPVFANVQLPGRKDLVRVEVESGMTLEQLRDAAEEIAAAEDKEDEADGL